MSGYQKLVTEDRRLALLTILAQDSDYAVNDGILQDALSLYGHSVSKDRLAADLDWLEEQELVEVEHVLNMRIAKLTQRGLDVSKGKTVVTGVKRPTPEF